MALFQKQLAKVDEFEEMLKKAVGDKGKVKNVGKKMYDVTFRDSIFSILDNGDDGLKILKFFCSKRECEKKFRLDYDSLLREAEQLDFAESRVPMYGKSIIMEIELPKSRESHREVRNIMEQIVTANQMMKDKVAEMQAERDAAASSSEQ